jgi:hypothetical protein
VTSAAELSIGARVEGVDRDAVRAELWERRVLVKTYTLRGTLHLVPAADLPLWLGARREVGDRLERGRLELAGVTPAQSEAITEAIGASLGGRPLTREELAEAVVGRLGAWAGAPMRNTWGSMLGPAAVRGLLCFGPPRGPRVTYVRPDAWIGRWREVDPHAALLEISRRYFAAYGPSNHTELARWFGMPPAQARAVVEELGPELVAVDVEGWRALAAVGDVERLASVAAGASTAAGGPPTGSGEGRAIVRLLPQYDAYAVGARPRDAVVDEALRRRVAGHSRGRYEGMIALQTVLVDGEIVGIWERAIAGRRLALRVELTRELDDSRLGLLEAEARRVGRFLGVVPDLSFGELSTGFPLATGRVAPRRVRPGARGA